MPEIIYRNLGDTELMYSIVVKKDQQAFNTFFNRYAHIVFGIGLKFTKDKSKAADIVQKVFQEIWQLQAVPKIQQLKIWLYLFTKTICLGIMRNTPIDTINILQSQERYDLETEYMANLGLDDVQLQQLIEDSFDKLPHEQKQCLHGFYINQFSLQETAVDTGHSYNQVKNYIQLGRRFIKSNIRKVIKNG